MALGLQVALALVLLSLAVQSSHQQQTNCTLSVSYQLQFPQVNCSGGVNFQRPSSVSVTLPCNENAQRVMELAVDIDSSYQFTSTYIGSPYGYRIDAINGTFETDECLWLLYYQAPGQSLMQFNDVGVTNFIIPGDGGSLIFRYRTLPLPSPTPTPDPDSAVSVVGGACSLLLAVCIGLALLL